MVRIALIFLMVMATSLAQAEDRTRELTEEGAAFAWLPGNDGTGAAKVRIRRGAVTEVAPSVAVEDLEWSPNRPVSVDDVPTVSERIVARRLWEERKRAAREAGRRDYYDRHYATYPRYYFHPKRPKVRAQLRLRLGDVTLGLGTGPLHAPVETIRGVTDRN